MLKHKLSQAGDNQSVSTAVAEHTLEHSHVWARPKCQMIHHQGKIRPCHGANNECIPILAQIKCLTPDFLAPKAPSSSALPPTSRDCTCCLQHMGFLMESKITGVQTWGGSGRCLAHPRQVQALPELLLCTWSSDFRKKAINGGFCCFPGYPLENQGLGHFQSHLFKPTHFYFSRKTTSISFLCTKHLKAPPNTQ